MVKHGRPSCRCWYLSAKRLKPFGLIVVLTLIPLCASCQPTPEEPAVVGKGDNTLESAIKADPSPKAAYEAPETWIETYLKVLKIGINYGKGK